MLFIPEFAPQQFGRVIRNLPQPLFQRLSAFCRRAQIGCRAGWRNGLGVAREFTAGAGLGVFPGAIGAALYVAVFTVLTATARLGRLCGSTLGGLAGRRFIRLRLLVGVFLLLGRITLVGLLLIFALTQRLFYQVFIVLRRG